MNWHLLTAGYLNIGVAVLVLAVTAAAATVLSVFVFGEDAILELTGPYGWLGVSPGVFLFLVTVLSLAGGLTVVEGWRLG